MKKIFLTLILIVLALFVCGFVFKNNDAELTNADYLRIHIRANSNSDVDQKIKYEIKDSIVEYLTPKVADCLSKSDVVFMINREIKNLENVANKVLNDKNFDYTAKIKINSEMFPTRTYEGWTLESGIYDALIVELGTAEGNNWWCVIYPPLCFTNYTGKNATSIVYKSKILEIIKKFFG